MYIGHIAGFVFLPVSVIMFLNTFGFLKLTELFGIEMAMIGAIGILAVEFGDIIDSHLKDENVILCWIIGLLICLPAIAFFLSKIMTLPAPIISQLPTIIASFLFVEGTSSFFIG